MSVYKDKKRGTYYVSYSYKDGLSGKFKHVTKRGFKSSKDAKQWERDNYGSYRANTKSTFLDVAKEWESAIQSCEQTRKTYNMYFEKRFGELQNRPIESISKADLAKWRQLLGESDFSTNTKNYTITLVRSVFKYNSDMYGAPSPAIFLKRFKKSNDELLKEMEVWTPEEFDTFLSMVDIRAYRLYFEFLFWTG